MKQCGLIPPIAVYVDNLGLFANTKQGMEKLKKDLNKSYEMTQLGEMKKILGLCSQRDCEAGILKISQGPYIETILAHFKMDNENPVSTTLNKTMKLIVPEPKEQ
jgi:hypothetical protein